MNLLCATGSTASCSGSGSSLTTILPLILIFAVMIVVMIVPQRRKDKAVKNMLAAIKPGDRVRTIGGIYGTISSVKDDIIVLLVGPDKVKMVFAKGAIAQVEEQGAEQTLNQEVK
ncbi:MAG: preprotein translocase subunit YajC [Eubacteriales bacterium]|nr:preprotein translocase subunit YajC [Eubacteriales bacterium]